MPKAPVRRASLEVPAHLKTVALLDRVIPEFDEFISGELIDTFLIPTFGARYRWHRPAGSTITRTPLEAFRRTFTRWRAMKRGEVPARTELRTAEWIAHRYAELVPRDTERLVVIQDFLPYLWKLGVLDNRSYEVLLTRAPLSVIHEKLNHAQKLLPRATTLGEFRAPNELIYAEAIALERAERVVTPHEEYASLFENIRKLEWQRPIVEPPPTVRKPRAMLFPASLVAREGAHAALAVADQLEVPIFVAGDNPEGLAVESDFVRFMPPEEIPWDEIAAVVHPTLFEAWPRIHLHALELQIPVIASEACGLSSDEKSVTIVPFADEEGLRAAVERVFARAADFEVEAHLRPASQRATRRLPEPHR